MPLLSEKACLAPAMDMQHQGKASVVLFSENQACAKYTPSCFSCQLNDSSLQWNMA